MKKKLRIALVVFLLCAFFFALYLFYLWNTLPTVEEIAARQITQSTKIYDRTGTVLLYEVNGGQQRTVVSFDTIPQDLKDATIITEDEQFYNEPGFDIRGILRALWVDVTHVQILQGGSTITQQLARNAFLSSAQTISRKIKELMLATRLDRHYSKDQILGLYLNEIPYGPTIYGVETASESYFNVSVDKLGLAQAALLAALPKAPTYYSPWGTHTKELFARQQFILKKMLTTGKITQKEYDDAKKFTFSFSPQLHGIKAPHFIMAVEEYLAQKYGEDTMQKGGLRVITTLDWDLQQVAEQAVSDGAKSNETLYQGKNAGLVAEDPKTGQILAMVGSRDYFDTKNDGAFNITTQGLRQPGSSLKPFVYYTAFLKGYTPDTVVFDVPTEFAAQNPACPPVPDFANNNPACFHPEDFDGQFRGPVSLRQALSQSINIPAVKMLYLAGLNDSVKTAYSFGLTTLTSPDLYGLSLVLGGGAVRLIDLVGAYSVLAQDGVKHAQAMVLQVNDSNGNTLESYADHHDVVAQSQPVRLVNNILTDVQMRSGLFQNSLSLTVFPDRDVALKTGTSNDYRDAWTVGYIPSLVVGVWAGNNDNSPMQRHGSSILAAVPIWHQFMAQAINRYQSETFIKPDPLYSPKAILRGDYSANNQIHTILYYVDKKDPLGPAPLNPSDDPQFTHWEKGVIDWALIHTPQFQTSYNQIGAPTIVSPPQSIPQNQSGPRIDIDTPAAGDFIGKQFDIRATMADPSSLTSVTVYWDNQKIQDFPITPTPSYVFTWSFTPPFEMAQNLLEIEVRNQNNQSSRSSVIVYH